jgi:hypothetical protein
MSNIIEQERKNIIENEQTAQIFINNYLENSYKNPNTNRGVALLKFFYTPASNTKLQGDLDLRIISTVGFNKVEKIYFTENKITSITNIPSYVKEFEIINNLLVEFKVPENIEKLNVSNNYITKLDLSKNKKLKILNITGNRIKKLENIPDTIEEIYANNNEIKILNLYNKNKLRVLHILNNNTELIQNTPKSLVDLKIESNPLLYIQNENEIPIENQPVGEQNVDFNDALNKYFKLKKKYETNLHKKRENRVKKIKNNRNKQREALMYVPECVNCGKPGGTLFFIKDKKYKAICGNKITPCNLNIEIYKASFTDLITELYNFKKIIDDIKNDIIIEKLNSIFGYIDDETTQTRHKKNIEEFELFSYTYNELLKTYDTLYNNTEKIEEIKHFTSEMYGIIEEINEMVKMYKKQGTHDDDNDGNSETENDKYLKDEKQKNLLKVAVKLQYDDLTPLINKIEKINFEVKEVLNYEKISILYKYENSISKLDYNNSGEKPRVIKFSK